MLLNEITQRLSDRLWTVHNIMTLGCDIIKSPHNIKSDWLDIDKGWTFDSDKDWTFNIVQA